MNSRVNVGRVNFTADGKKRPIDLDCGEIWNFGTDIELGQFSQKTTGGPIDTQTYRTRMALALLRFLRRGKSPVVEMENSEICREFRKSRPAL